MFLFRRVVNDIGRKSIGYNHFRLYCNASKQFKNQSGSADTKQSFWNNEIGDEQQNKNKNDEDDEENAKQRNNSSNSDSALEKELTIHSQFNLAPKKDRETFFAMVKMFVERDKHRRHHVEFIYAALKHMEEYGVERDLEAYKEILNVMPKGKMVATNMFQQEFMHYPKQQDCAIFLLDQMEYNAVMPDDEIRTLIINIFGKRSHPMYKYGRMMYWMPKFKHLSPWLLPDPIPEDPLELAKLAVRQMCSIDVESTVQIFNTEHVEDSLDKTWIVSGQSPEQKKLLKNHSLELALKVQGPFAIWLRNRSIKYFTLIGDAEPDDKFAPEENEDDVRRMPVPKFLNFMSPKSKDVVVKKPKRSIHQQDDGTIYAICATGTSTKDSLLSWIRLLEKNGNPSLAHIPVLFTFKTPVDDRSLVVNKSQNENEIKK